MNEEELRRWDDWFALVGDEDYECDKLWGTVKDVIPRQDWLRWAVIIESNRISAVNQKAKEAEVALQR